MKELVTRAVDTATKLGADYADVRGITERREDLATRNGAIATLNQSEKTGMGARLLRPMRLHLRPKL